MRYLSAILLVACSHPAATPAPATTPPAPSAPGIGEKCGEADACASPATCVSYLGIAGASGPTFKSCEVKCTPDKPECPGGRTCKTIADGPGSVCR